MSQTGRVSDDPTPPDDLPSVTPSEREHPNRRHIIGSTSESRFPAEALVLGVAVVALLVAGLVTLLSLGGGDDDQLSGDDQLSIGAEPDRPNPTFDASISDDDEPSSSGRDISITDEPIVIDADGNMVDPDGGNGGAALPSADDGLEVPDDAFTGTAADDPDVATGAPAAADERGADDSRDSDDGESDDVESDDGEGDDGANLLGGDDPEDKRMPDLICRGLQAAQDEIQDRGVFGSKSRDATGQGRRQLWDRNWVVVAQDPEPGEKIGEFEAILYVVKNSDDDNPCD